MRLQFKSVKMRLTFWFLTVTMLSLLTGVTILYFQRASVIRKKEFEMLQIVRDLKVSILTRWLNERIGELKNSAGDEEIRALEKVLGTNKNEWSGQDLKMASTARSLLQRHMDAQEAFSEMFVLDAFSGKVAISSDQSMEGKDKKEELYLTEPIRTRNMYIKDIYFSETKGTPSMIFSAPIFCLEHAGEHLIGVLVFRVDMEKTLYPLIQDYTGMGETGETLVVNKDGYALNELRWYENAPLKLRITAEPAARGAAGETGIIETKDYRGQMVLAAYTNIPLTNWGFVAKRDQVEAYEQIRVLLLTMILLIGVTALLVSVVSLVLAGTLSRPILSIKEIAERFAEGDFDARCPVEGNDEIAMLGVSFNKMAVTLNSQIAIVQGGAGISEIMAAAGNVEDFTSELLIKLIDISGSHLGAFYVRSENEEVFKPVASIGLIGNAAQSFNAEGYEGELGKSLATGQVSLIQNIPADTVFTFKTTGGTVIPREILTIPLIVDSKVRAVISLATLGTYSNTHRKILDLSLIGMTTAFSNLLTNAKTEQLAEELRSNNEELRSMMEELHEQTEELSVQQLQVAEANRLKSEFLSNMSHELRTPLNSVMALSQLMLSRGSGKNPEKDAEHLSVIRSSGQQLLNLINDILDLSKIESGRVDLVLVDFDPRDLVERTLGTVQPLADKKGLRLKKSCTEVPRMFSDEERIGQILLNLLSNAVKFTEKGWISLDVSAAEGMVSFAVTDTGIGIDEADILHIFEEFRQVDGSTTRRHEGTGLGLAISRKIASLLGGRIMVKSVPGEGSTFTLHLPARGSEAHAEYGSATGTRLLAEDQPGPGHRNHRRPLPDRPLVLVIDDNEVAALQVQNALMKSGYRVTVTRSGAAGLDAVREEVPDAVILDLMMPEVDGFQVLEQIRSNTSIPDLPVLVLTAKELTAADRARLTHNNIRELIQKGNVDQDTLVARVADMIRKPAVPEQAASPAEFANLEKLSMQSERSKTILIVEDNSDNLYTIQAILDNMGCTYISAHDGEQAVKAAKESRPGLILMDIQLPLMSGLEATTRIKADPELRGTPIVAVTARAMKGDREEILKAGCDDYLTKPLDSSEVEDIVRKWLEPDRRKTS